MMIPLGSSIWAAKSIEESGAKYILEDRFDQATGIYFKKIPDHDNVVASETAIDTVSVSSFHSCIKQLNTLF